MRAARDARAGTEVAAMTWKEELAGAEDTSGDEPREAIRRELEARGVAEGFARAAAEALLPFAEDLEGDRWKAVVSGVTLAYGVHRRSIESFQKTAQDLDEVDRLLGSFGTELRKLDEALEILAAYVARLRVQTGTPAARRVH